MTIEYRMRVNGIEEIEVERPEQHLVLARRRDPETQPAQRFEHDGMVDDVVAVLGPALRAGVEGMTRQKQHMGLRQLFRRWGQQVFQRRHL
ncbi:MAG: hypothetical protein E5Y60_06070 [Mesorhizobium sp.]|nr:MAG: hypothetical protein E5Y60_06070 [Mesorhizobium sp.]